MSDKRFIHSHFSLSKNVNTFTLKRNISSGYLIVLLCSDTTFWSVLLSNDDVNTWQVLIRSSRTWRMPTKEEKKFNEKKINIALNPSNIIA